MDVIINSDYIGAAEPDNLLVSQGTALLNLLSCLKYDPANPPLAALLSNFYKLAGYWVILSPVHWEATHNDAVISATGKQLNLSETQAKQWFSFCAQYFAGENMKLYYHDAETWLLFDPHHHPLQAKPPQQLVYKSLMPELSQLDPTLFWQKIITESQMLFAAKPNQSLINGLWPWGSAPLNGPQKVAICADEEFLALAKNCSSRVNCYTPQIKLKEQQILIITDLSRLSKAHQEELKKLFGRWYWNNIAYTTGHQGWFRYLWRKLKPC